MSTNQIATGQALLEGLNLTQRRPPVDVGVTLLRELEEQDILQMLAAPRGVQPQALKKLRGVHHRIARLLAEGMKEADVSRICGVGGSHISILKGDPAFKGLLEHYSGVVAEAHVDFVGNLADLRDTAVSELHERLLDKPDEMSTSALIEIVKMGSDRTGFGVQSKVKVSGGVAVLTKSEIDALKAELSAESQTIDVSGRNIQQEG